MAEQCSNCYYKKFLDSPLNIKLVCRRNPVAVWVRGDHWCGEYVPEDFLDRLAEQETKEAKG